jgi:cold shock CspA family protein
MDTLQTFIGHITRFDNQRNFGFIETENNEQYFFFFDKAAIIAQKRAGLIEKVHKYCSGDEVEFKLQPSLKDSTKLQAYDLKFLRNQRRELLIEEAKTNDILLGYLKLIDNEKFFVKHISTYIFIELKISNWETNLQANYYERIDTLVEFKLSQLEKIDRLSATLVDRNFKDEFENISNLRTSQEIIAATVTGQNKSGFFVTILDNTTNAFISCNEEKLSFYNFKKGDKVNVIVKGHHDNGVRVEVA